MLPLCLLMPSYNCLLLDFDGQSITNLISFGGAFTLVHPVVKEKSWPRCFDSASFHYSRSPVYFLFLRSLVTLLYTYNQHALFGSIGCVFVLVFAGFHISVVGFGTGTVSSGLSTYYVCSICGVGVVGWNLTYFFASRTCIAAFFASAGVLSTIMRSKMSSSVSGASSLGCSCVLYLDVFPWIFVDVSL
jgi:hypothetical protein